MSKNQIWALIAIVAIGVLALVTDIQIKVEVGAEDYVHLDECIHKEILKCPNGMGKNCANSASYYCETLDLPED